MLDEAYLLRAGKPLDLPAIDLTKPKGKRWEETALAAAYPALVQYYQAERLEFHRD